jgi:hypothetical protein
MNKDLLRQVAVVLTFIATVTTNGLANGIEINGFNTGEISDMFVNFITPPGYVFSIWGVIYLGLAAFTVYQALPSQRTNPRLRRIGWLFAVSNLLNGSWILFWHYLQFGMSWVVIVALLITLLLIYTRLGIGRQPVSTKERLLVWTPFSIYTGWITVATIVATTVQLQVFGFEGGPLTEPIWSALVLVVGAVIGGYVTYTRRDAAYGAVIIWAYVGIVVKYLETNLVAYTAGGLAVVVLLLLIAALFTQRPPSGRLQGSAA